jgi:Zn-dependent protease
VAAAGPAMNLLLAIVAINVYVLAERSGSIAPVSPVAFSLAIMAQLNLLLMLFNLIPLGPLDGHYIVSWFLPPRVGDQYDRFNVRYGSMIFMALIILSIAGVPVFRMLTSFAATLMPYLTFV